MSAIFIVSKIAAQHLVKTAVQQSVKIASQHLVKTAAQKLVNIAFYQWFLIAALSQNDCTRLRQKCCTTINQNCCTTRKMSITVKGLHLASILVFTSAQHKWSTKFENLY